MRADREPLVRYALPVLIGWVVLSYGWTTTFGFANDDYVWVAGVHFAKHDSWLRALLHSPFSSSFVRPVVELSFAINYLAGGLHPFVYHLTNVALYALNVCLVWILARDLLRNPAAALATALLFATHPAHTEAVTWISGRTELLAAAFVLAALVLHRRGRWGMAAAAFCGGLLSKESAICFPLLVLITDGLAPPRPRRFSIVAAYLCLLLPYALLRLWTTQSFTLGLPAVWMLAGGDYGGVVRSALVQAGRAMRFLLAPLPLSGVIAGETVALLFALAWRLTGGEERRRVWLAAGWVAATCLPFLPLFWVAERYVYLASFGLQLLLVLLGRAAWKRAQERRALRPALATIAACWIIASAVAVQRSNQRWRRNTEMSDHIIDSIVATVPRPQAGTVFVVTGLRDLIAGAVPGIRQPVMLFGLPEALRIRFGEPQLDVVLPEARSGQRPDPSRPTVHLHWNERTERIER